MQGILKSVSTKNLFAVWSLHPSVFSRLSQSPPSKVKIHANYAFRLAKTPSIFEAERDEEERKGKATSLAVPTVLNPRVSAFGLFFTFLIHTIEFAARRPRRNPSSSSQAIMVASPPPAPPLASSTFKLTSSLDVNAPPFYPSFSWYPEVTDEYYDEHPHSPGSSGFVIADSFFSMQEIPDEELFDAKFHPLTSDELLELEQVDEINSMLADLELMETHQELYQEHQKSREIRSPSDVDEELQILMKKPTTTTKYNDYSKYNSNTTRLPKKKMGYQGKKPNMFAPIQQPRSVK